jgi:hypothetical protein
MIFSRTQMACGISFLCLFLGASKAVAQDQKPDTDAQQPQPQQPQQPLDPAGTGNTAGVTPYSKEDPGVDPDTRPLSGFQKLSLGTSQANHSFLLPSFTVVGQAQSDPSGQSGGDSVSESVTLTGRLALSRVTSVSSLTLDYLAGASFSSGTGQGTSGIQSLDFSDTFHRGRWSLLAGDEFMYLSQSPFGFGGLGGLGGYGVPLGNGGTGAGTGSGLDGQSPNQTIFTNGNRISDAVLGQADYSLTHRSSLTFGVNYGFLKYIGTELNNNSTLAADVGYNYLLSRKDTMSISFNYGRFMFGNSSPSFESEGLQFGYGRRITNRVSFQIGAGPQFQMFTLPLKGPTTIVSWALSTSANYTRGSFNASASYSHGLSGGSGVLNGAESDAVSGSVSKAFNRDWNGSGGFGFSKNKALEQTNANPISPTTWFFSARANRRFFSNGSLFISYGLSKQSSLAGVCTLSACQIASTTQYGSVGYTWSLHQIVLE